MPLNPELDSLSDYPFEALRALLNPVTPRVNDTPILMSVGEPQHQPPALLAETLTAHAHEWKWDTCPPMAGTPELRQAIVDWLTCALQAHARVRSTSIKHIAALAGTKEALPLRRASSCAREGGQKPVVLVPEPLLPRLQRRGDDGRRRGDVPRCDPRQRLSARSRREIPKATLERCALFYLCSLSNPQGHDRRPRVFEKGDPAWRGEYDFVLAADECYAELIRHAAATRCARSLPSAPGENGLFDNVVVFHSLEAVERGGAALGVCRRRSALCRSV